MSRVIITDCDHSNIQFEKEVLHKEEISFELKQCKTEEDLISQCQDAEVLINQYAPISRKVMEQLSRLKMIVRYGVGVNNVDVEAATELQIQVCNVPDYGVNEVADHAIAMMLNFTRKIGMMNKQVHKGVWDYQKSIPLYRHSEMTVGVIGVGRIGSSFAEKAKTLGFQVLGYDTRYKRDGSKERPSYVEFTDLQGILERSDVVSIHCPVDRAHHMIGERELLSMKETAYLINVSRGGIVDESALAQALKEKWIAGAALDVTEIEPIPTNSKLLQHDNFICTPHMAWYSVQAEQELKRKVAEEAARFLRSNQVQYPVNHLNA